MNITNKNQTLSQGDVNGTKRWLLIAVLSLAISGIYSIIVALLRVPQIHKIMPYDESFKVSLIIHVDLSVIIWFLSIHLYFLSKSLSIKFQYITGQFFWIALASIILISISPFLAEGKPYLNNYVPILHNIIFIVGLAIFLSTYFAMVILFLIDFFTRKRRLNAYIDAFLLTSALTAIIMFFVTYVSYKQLMELHALWEGDYFFFFEYLFWGGGHVLQFVYIALGQFVWIYFFTKMFPKVSEKDGWLSSVFIINFLCVVPAIYFSIAFNVSSNSYIEFYTFHMKHFGGLSSLILAAILIFCAVKFDKSKTRNLDHYFFCSAVMFVFGGGLGFVINESSTIIPAHYHGSIVAITIAIMGYIYEQLKESDLKDKFNKISLYQIYIYFFGQFLHIAGLAFSGGYGALRKTPGGVYTAKAKFFLGLIGAGGLFAMIGGLIFVYISIRYFMLRKGQNNYIA